LRYLIPAEQFTTFPYLPSRTYLRGDVVYVPDQGECYQALRVTTAKDPATEILYWRRCLFPEVLAQYVKAGAYADTLRETDTGDERDPVMLQIRGQKAAIADAEAEDEINRQINRLQAQGQNYFYLPFGVAVPGARRAGALCSVPRYVLQGGGPDYGPIAPTGTGATTISDQCETEWGYIPPVPIGPAPAVIWEYHREIVSLTGPALPSLRSLDTVPREVSSLVIIILTVGGSRQEQNYELRGGEAESHRPGPGATARLEPGYQ